MYNVSAKGANFSIWLAALMHLPHDTNKLRAEPQAHTCTWLLALNSAHYTAESKVGPVSYSPLFSLSCFLFSLSASPLSSHLPRFETQVKVIVGSAERIFGVWPALRYLVHSSTSSHALFLKQRPLCFLWTYAAVAVLRLAHCCHLLLIECLFVCERETRASTFSHLTPTYGTKKTPHLTLYYFGSYAPRRTANLSFFNSVLTFDTIFSIIFWKIGRFLFLYYNVAKNKNHKVVQHNNVAQLFLRRSIIVKFIIFWELNKYIFSFKTVFSS